MAETKDITGWAALTSLVNELKSPNQFIRRLVFSNEDLVAAETFEVPILIGDRVVSPFARRTGEAIEITPYTEKRLNVTTSHVRVKRHLNPAELILDRQIGGAIFVDEGDVLDGAEREISRTSQRLNDVVTEAEEYLCAQALRGSITYEVDEEEAFEVVFPRSSSHDVTLTDFWDLASGNPSDDFLTAKQLVSDDVGLGLTHVLLGSEATTAFLNSDGVRALLDTQNISAGQVTFNEQFNADGSIFLGNFSGLAVWSYSRKTTVAGASYDLVRPKYAEFVSVLPEAENTMYFGPISDITALEGRAIRRRRFSKSWVQEDPSVWWQLVTSRPLPVPRRPDSMVSMKVVSG